MNIRRVLIPLMLTIFLSSALGGNIRALIAFPLVAPPNDDFDNALVVTPLPFTDVQDTQQATTALDDPTLPGLCFFDASARKGNATVWYKFTAPTKGRMRANTFGTLGYDTVLAVWTGTRGSLSLATCNDDASDIDVLSAVTLTVSAGVIYNIEVADVAQTLAVSQPKSSFPQSPAIGGILHLKVDFIGDTFFPVILRNGNP